MLADPSTPLLPQTLYVVQSTGIARVTGIITSFPGDRLLVRTGSRIIWLDSTRTFHSYEDAARSYMRGKLIVMPKREVRL
jgi:hypothetical protein